MLDEWVDEFEKLRLAGAIVLLKWDGQRSANPCTVVVTRHDTDFIFRRDTDDLQTAIGEAVSAYWAAHA
jgi:hypothetical protein